MSISERNRWLIPGPDTMPLELRARRQWLGNYWTFKAEGIMEYTREAWLAIPRALQFEILLKHLYHPKKVAELYAPPKWVTDLLPELPWGTRP